MKRQAKNPNPKRSFQRLVRMALRRWETNDAWRAIAELQMRGSPSTLERLRAMVRSPDWRRRSLGLYVVAQLKPAGAGTGTSADPVLQESQALLLAGLDDPHGEVVRAAVSGLAHRPHPGALAGLVRLSSHPDELLRRHVAVSLSTHQDPLAVEALLRLMVDEDDEVREWATFGIGTLQPADSAQVRAALWKNARDPVEDVRGEALLGLAARRDEQLADHLLGRLDMDCRVHELDAAEKLADPRMLGGLRALAAMVPDEEAGGYWFSHLQAAITACRRAAAKAG